MIDNIKHFHDDPMIIDGMDILPGESHEIKLLVGRLPSGTRIFIEAKVFRSKTPGPTVLITGGIHGDEINGIQAVKQSLEEAYYDNLLKGTVIAMPLVNAFGFINFSRDVPDGKDVNRSFPGSKTGSLAARVANKLTQNVLPHVDLIIDFHTGGAFRYNYPQVRYSPKDAIAAKLAKAFGVKYCIEKTMIDRSLRKIAFSMNIPTIVYEGGESVRLDGLSIAQGMRGIKNVLRTLDMLPKPQKEDAVEQILCTKTTWLRSPYSGIFIWSISSGNYVEKGEVIGEISDPYANKKVLVKAKKSGHLIGHNNASVVNQGDALFHIAFVTSPM